MKEEKRRWKCTCGRASSGIGLLTVKAALELTWLIISDQLLYERSKGRVHWHYIRCVTQCACICNTIRPSLNMKHHFKIIPALTMSPSWIFTTYVIKNINLHVTSNFIRLRLTDGLLQCWCCTQPCQQGSTAKYCESFYCSHLGR